MGKKSKAEARGSFPPTATKAEKKVVQEDVGEVKKFLGTVTLDDFQTGNWFVKLLTFALGRYSAEVDAAYFRRKYPDLPPDAVVDARIQLAANYASIEGGLSATAYSSAVAATIGSGGGASPLTLPTGAVSFLVDLSYTSYLQLRMAYDIAILYGIPVDMKEPDDLWKLVRAAFAIKGSQSANEALLKSVPAVVRPIVKKIFSGSTLATLKSLPVVGKYLLQRNIIKFAIPVVSIPLSVTTNYWATRIAGKQARASFRREARIIEQAGRVTRAITDREAMMWSAWLIMQADDQVRDDERLFLHHLTRYAREAGLSEEALSRLSDVVDVEADEVWKHLAGVTSDRELKAIYRASVLVAAVDGKLDKRELELLVALAEHCHMEFDPEAILRLADRWSP